jgi:hypothetical protein
LSGTLTGGKKAAENNKRKYGRDFYAKIGSKGGKASTTGGFYANRELASIAGAKGGKRGHRTADTPDELFVRLWNCSPSPATVAKVLDQKQSTAVNRAVRLRKKGYVLKPMPKGRYAKSKS